MRIRWTPAAAADLQRISDYLGVHHPSYRAQTMRKLYAAIRDLKEQTLEVLRIYHTAQERS